MKKILIFSFICMIALNLFSQTLNTKTTNSINHTNINIPQLGIIKISVVLDILNQNTYFLERTQIQIIDEKGNTQLEENGSRALYDISKKYKENNTLSDTEVKVLKALVEIVQPHGVLTIETEYPSVEKSYSDMAKYQKKASKSLSVLATTSVIALIFSVISLIAVSN